MNRNRLSGITLILVALATVVVLTNNGNVMSGGYGHIIINGDFESGEKTGWSGYGCRLEIVSDDVYHGKYACRAWLDQEWGGGHRTTFWAPKGKYHVVMYVKTNPGMKSRCQAGAIKFDGPNISVPVKRQGSWVEIAFDVRIRETSCDLYTWGPKTPGGWILLDEVTVTPIP